MYYIHYPPGGFGYFMLQMSSICFDDVFCPQETSTFGEDGNSHSYPLHCKTWWHSEKYTEEHYFNFKGKKSICLIDSGIDSYEDRGMKNTIRMCIDKDARSIVYQTCREKAELLDFNFGAEDYQIREYHSITYRHCDKNPDYYLNNWKPTSATININISDLFFNPHRLISQLEPHFGECSWGKFWKLWNDFIRANYKYYQAQHLVNRVKHALEAGFDFEFKKNYSLHDQGYLTYWLEKQYNIQEIPPYDYRHWFKNTQEIRDCLNSIRSQ